jgi:predicted O-methyltransferase YrrM
MISDLKSKLDTLRWYAARPSLYRELGRRILHWNVSTTATNRKRDEERLLGRKWCESCVVAPAELFEALGIPQSLDSVAALHPDIWATALQVVADCPVKMGGPANVDVLYHLARHLKVRSVIETGVASGWSSLSVLLAMGTGLGGRLISIDMPYAKLNNEQYVGCAVPASLRPNWKLVRRSDRDALGPALNELAVIDLAHYDSDKSDAGRRFAYPKLWAALRPGGVLMSDDIEDTLAFRDFAASVDRRAWVLAKEKPGNFAGVLIR